MRPSWTLNRRSALGYGAALGAAAMVRPGQAFAAGNEVTIWSPIVARSPTKPVYSRLKQIFETANQGYTLTLVDVGWSPMRDKVFAAVRSKHGPDIVDFQTVQMPSYAALGGFSPIDSLFDASGLQGKVWDLTREYGSWGEHMYAMPWGLDVAMGMLYYRQDMFDKAGIKQPPETMEELVEISTALTRSSGDKKQWGMAFSGVPGDALDGGFLDTFYGYGGQVFQQKDGKTVIGIDTPEARAALQLCVDMLRKQKIVHPDSPSYNSDDMRNALIRGEVAMVPSGFRHWASSFVPLAKPLIDQGILRVAPWPAGPKGRRICLFVIGYCITSFPETNKDAAWKLVQTALQPEVIRELAIRAGYGPIVKSVWDEPEYQSLEAVRVLRTIIEKYAAPFDTHPLQVPIMRGVMERMVAQALSGETSPEDAIKAAQQQANAMLVAYEKSAKPQP